MAMVNGVSGEVAEGEGSGAVGHEKAGTPLKPSACRSYMRKELAKNFKAIVKGFVDEAKTGSCPHVKLTNELLEGAPGKKVSRRKGSAELMLEKWTGKAVVKPPRVRGGNGMFVAKVD